MLVGFPGRTDRMDKVDLVDRMNKVELSTRAHEVHFVHPPRLQIPVQNDFTGLSAPHQVESSLEFGVGKTVGNNAADVQS